MWCVLTSFRHTECSCHRCCRAWALSTSRAEQGVITQTNERECTQTALRITFSLSLSLTHCSSRSLDVWRARIRDVNARWASFWCRSIELEFGFLARLMPWRGASVWSGEWRPGAHRHFKTGCEDPPPAVQALKHLSKTAPGLDFTSFWPPCCGNNKVLDANLSPLQRHSIPKVLCVSLMWSLSSKFGTLCT